MAKICLVFIIAIFSESVALHLGAFNPQIFGKTKFSKPEVVQVLKKIVLRYDIVLIQEIRDASETVIYDFVDVLNSEKSPYTYNVVVGPRLGRSSSKEQYAYIYRNETVEILYNYTHPDNDDVFEREPFVVLVRDLTETPIPDFVLIGVHVKPTDAQAELDGLVKAYEKAVDIFNTTYIILLGDMNADCQYLKDSENEQLKITTDERLVWLINKTVDTTVAASSCSYDRFVATLSIIKLIIKGSVRIFRFDEVCGLNETQTKKVSDHYPIELQLVSEKFR